MSAADPDTLVLADGFSCRTQIEQGAAGRKALHLAEALVPATHRRHLTGQRERANRFRRLAGTAAAGLLAVAGVAWAALAARNAPG
jgi:hypothetical protein